MYFIEKNIKKFICSLYFAVYVLEKISTIDILHSLKICWHGAPFIVSHFPILRFPFEQKIFKSHRWHSLKIRSHSSPFFPIYSAHKYSLSSWITIFSFVADGLNCKKFDKWKYNWLHEIFLPKIPSVLIKWCVCVLKTQDLPSNPYLKRIASTRKKQCKLIPCKQASALLQNG